MTYRTKTGRVGPECPASPGPEFLMPILFCLLRCGLCALCGENS